MKILVTLTEPMLGTQPGNAELAKDFVVAKSQDEAKIKEETEALSADESLDKMTTYFPRVPGTDRPMIWEYQVKGFLKEAIGVLVEVGDGGELTKWTYKRLVDSFIFVFPRHIEINLSGELTFIERSLRVITARGERVCLARSEAIPAGSTFLVDLKVLESTNAKSKAKSFSVDLVKKALDYGSLKGLGQWRNSGCGRFSWKEVAE